MMRKKKDTSVPRYVKSLQVGPFFDGGGDSDVVTAVDVVAIKKIIPLLRGAVVVFIGRYGGGKGWSVV